MDFTLSEEQQMLQESVTKFVQNSYGFEQRKKWSASELGFNRENWALFAELGWLSLPFAEAYGGFGGTPVDTMIFMEALGKGLVLEPWISTVLLCGKMIETIGSEDQKQEYLSGIIQGEMLFSLAYLEHRSGNNPYAVQTTAELRGDDYIINGHKVMVLNGTSADKFLVTARVSGSERAPSGIRVFVVDADASGLSQQGFATIEGGRAAELELKDVKVRPEDCLGNADAGYVLEAIVDHGIIALCAAAVGAMDVLYRATVEYTKTRKQFGVPIGKFQALQHRMVDMFIAYEQSKSSLYMAALHALEGDPNIQKSKQQAQKSASALKVKVGQAGRYIGQEAIQLHGGMGMTDELDVGYYFKFLTVADALFGNVDYHLDRYSAAF